MSCDLPRTSGLITRPTSGSARGYAVAACACDGPLGPALGLPLTWGMHEAAAQEIEACAAKHLALQHFEAIDVPLDRTSTPGQGDVSTLFRTQNRISF